MDDILEIDTEICNPDQTSFDTSDVVVIRGGKTSNIKKQDSIPWVEKYRPNKLEDVMEQNEIINILKKTLETGELPHLLLHGPPGTGKTTTILALARQLYGPKKIDEKVIELNASDDRGIGAVRTSIITFAKISVGSSDPDYPSPPYKIIILDEADSMTPDAQAALRKTMESNSKITRFCFICNYDAQIIGPIASRCMKFRFKPLGIETIVNRLRYIADKESVNIDDNAIRTIALTSDGDMRRSIMTLQNIKYVVSGSTKITSKLINEMTGGIDVNKLKKIWDVCKNGNVKDLFDYSNSLYREGYHVKNIFNYIKQGVLESKYSEKAKANILLELCTADRRLLELGDEQLQILNILVIIKQNIT